MAQARERGTRWKVALRRIETPSHGAAAGVAPSAATEAALARLAVPWGPLYGAIERCADDSVTLLAITPNAEKGELQLLGEAKDFAALRGYLERLGAASPISEARLLGQEIRQSDSQKPIVFRIAAAWRSRP